MWGVCEVSMCGVDCVWVCVCGVDFVCFVCVWGGFVMCVFVRVL